jgi:long-subunit fatty acid transport protein
MIKPHHKVGIGIMYRMWSTIKLTGETETELLPDLVLQSTADWYIPHALQFGVSYQANKRLLLAWELRLQFHGAEKQGNTNQTVTARLPIEGSQPLVTTVGFGWKNIWSAKFGVEYRFKKDVLSFRGGLNVADSAATEAWAQYFTPPPGISVTGMLGLGFYWDDRNDPNIKDKYLLDIGTLIAYSGTKIGDEYIGTDATVPGTSDQQTLCSADQVVRTGCPGQVGVFTYWASVSFTLQY